MSDPLTAAVVCLALNVYHEARGEPIEGQVAVAAVTMNRVRAERWPGDVCDVVMQAYQFSWRHDRLPDSPRDARALTRSMLVARMVLSGAVNDPTGGATYFHAKRVRPYWADAMLPVGVYGKHVFYREVK